MLETFRDEAALGCWISVVWRPEPGDVLFGAVDRIWDYEGWMATHVEHTFPNGLLELVIQLDEPHRPSIGAPHFPQLAIDGLATVSATVVGPSGSCRVIGIRLRPCGAAALLGSGLAELTGRTTDLTAVIGRSADDYGARLHAARGGHARIAVAARWARMRLSRARDLDASVVAAAAAIERDGGARALLEIDAFAGRSRSRFAARFRDAIGLAPKRFARVVRFRGALDRVRTTRQPFATIAADLGYFDQAHFATEFRAHAGLSPRAYREASGRFDSDHVVDFA